MKNQSKVVVSSKFVVPMLLIAFFGVVEVALANCTENLTEFFQVQTKPDISDPTKSIVEGKVCYGSIERTCDLGGWAVHKIRKLISYEENGTPKWSHEGKIVGWPVLPITTTKHDSYDENLFVISEPGLYEVVALLDNPLTKERRTEVWRQWIYVPYPKPANHEELAKKYMPIVAFHNEEAYYPKTIDSILRFKEAEKQLAISAKTGNVYCTMGDDIIKFLRTQGNSGYAFNFWTPETECDPILNPLCSPIFMRNATGACGVGEEESGGIFCATREENRKFPVYYQIVQAEDGWVYLSYYFIYAFDPKLGTQGDPDLASHVFDRESFTIVMDSQLEPKRVVYGAHLPGQTVEFKGCKGEPWEWEGCLKDSGKAGDTMVSWTEGKVKLAWKNVPKLGSHPIVYKAKGSHAIFPTYGWYKVSNPLKGLWTTLTEPVGNIDGSYDTKFPSNWLLEELDLSQPKQSALTFSGYWVDMLGPSSGEKFPPFIRLPQYWIVGPSSDFDACLDGTKNSAVCNERTKKYFDNVKGVGNKGAYAGKLVDSITEKPITMRTGVKVKVGNAGWQPLDVYSDGSFTHFVEVDNGTTQQVSLTFCVPGYFQKKIDDTSITVGKTTNLNENGYEQEILLETGSTVGCDDGKMEGLVKDAVTNTPLSGVSVQIFQAGNLINQGNTDTSGRYYFSLPEGDYALHLSLEGYIPVDVNVHVTPNETYNVTPLRQVSQAYAGEGIVGGKITDAFNGAGLAGVYLSVQRGVNVDLGMVAIPLYSTETDNVGNYIVNLPGGNYTIKAMKEGYISNSFTVVSVGGMSMGNQDASLTRPLFEGQLRIVLSWGSEPSDLDSHLVTPTIEGKSHHILYNSKGSSNQAPYVQLDRDWTHGKGPETVTIYTRYPGQYCYYVHNYSDGGNTQSQRLTTSEAKVEVYPSQGPVRTYNVPTQGMGTYWNVFCYDGSTGVLTNLNEILATAPQR